MKGLEKGQGKYPHVLYRFWNWGHIKMRKMRKTYILANKPTNVDGKNHAVNVAVDVLLAPMNMTIEYL